jgi:calpain-15
LLTAISSLAERPDRVKALFKNEHEEPNDAGIYGVRIYKNGEETNIVVDDWLPTLKGKPAFSHANGHELWVLILEKVWAKLHGCYHALESGLTMTALRDLTGAPAFITNISDVNPDELWNQIHEADKKDWIMGIASQHDDQKMVDIVENLGIQTYHAYSLIDAHEITVDHSKVRLLKIRNPWGKKEWNGEWSDDSAKWTLNLRN